MFSPALFIGNIIGVLLNIAFPKIIVVILFVLIMTFQLYKLAKNAKVIYLKDRAMKKAGKTDVCADLKINKEENVEIIKKVEILENID